MPAAPLAIEATGITKSFGETQALRGVDLAVPAGTICGLLGPNGAGKSTLVRILTTLERPDGGWATVAGHDVVAAPDRVRHHLGLVGQHPALDEKITGRDNLRMFGRLHHLGERAARRRADQLLDEVELTDAADRLVGTYSGGMRRRLDLAVGVITAPPVLFLDEPTTGLDPRSRAEIWERIRGLVRDGTTVLLTTQYLDEADRLADQIVIVDRGEVIGRGRPAELKAGMGSGHLDLVLADPGTASAAGAALEQLLGHPAHVVPAAGRVSVPTDGPEGLVAAVVELDRLGIVAEDISLRRPTLDDVFLAATGHPTPVPA
jgi:ABC-2 type transport system ATP-binding protein